MTNKITFQAGEIDVQKTVYQFLKEQGVSSTLIKQLKNNQLIQINGNPVQVKSKVNQGEQIELHMPVECSEGLKPEPIHFEILHEDEDLLIINKPANLTIHPTFNHVSGTLANGVLHYWQANGQVHRFRPVNRLDKDTSGVVIIARNAYVHHHLSEQQQSGEFQKGYAAFVHGMIMQDEGEINQPIGRKEDSIIEREVRKDGQSSITRFRVEKRYTEMTWVKIQLLTGRTHQIRVHFAYIGHPLIGDDLYGGDRKLISRQALHAEWVRFKHPRTKKEVTFHAPWPSDLMHLQTFCEMLNRGEYDYSD